MFGGFKVQGKSGEAAKGLIEAAQAVERSRTFMLIPKWDQKEFLTMAGISLSGIVMKQSNL